MRRQRANFCMVVAAALASVCVALPGGASPGDEYAGPYFGAGNLPPGCVRDMSPTNPANTCYHMLTGLNTLDSPVIDVAVLVPASPTAERDLRIMRQSVQMWEGGIEYLADEMGLDWLRDGVKFTITPSIVGAATGADATSTYPLIDPEIVVLGVNPVGAGGIGTDPVTYTRSLGIVSEDLVPCHNIANPFALETWEGLPGYDGHHDDNGGVYVEDCGGAGGNVCVAVNTAIDPVPDSSVLITNTLFDLVAHEVGHCLSVGHVGDGADATWWPVPSRDIMAYARGGWGDDKCVSTLDVEGFALRMSRYLDVNGDGAVTTHDRLQANDPWGNGVDPFQVMSPADYLFASGTGSPDDCPKPDLGVLPGTPTDWTPEPVDTTTTLTGTRPLPGL